MDERIQSEIASCTGDDDDKQADDDDDLVADELGDIEGGIADGRKEAQENDHDPHDG